LHQVGRETPLDVLGAHLSQPVCTTWCPCPPGQLSWEPGKEGLGSAHRCEDKTEGNLAGAIDLGEYSMLCNPRCY